MNQPPQSGASPPWFLIIGLLAGAAFVGYIVWDSAKPPSRNVVELTKENWQREVVESNVPVFVDFTAKWCRPCQAFAPTVNRLADRYKGKIKVAKFDVGDQSFDRAGDIAAQFGIKGIPHVIIFKGGSPEPIEQFTPPFTESQFARYFDKLLASR